ncbi:hypothetical protein ACJ72_04573 [Emergomyces africanus]|uniref:Uncharacterized protein n=1 Tax=Emergomyces africanus TaxID=1955775 RepID=A0A1B7NWE3_9EURO|nr:hypothetical protein ACJ72_04573 [Emergomyces africanus]
MEATQLLESSIRSTREAMNSLPCLSILDNETAVARAEMEDILTQMKNMVTNSREALRDTTCIHQEIDELKDKLSYIEKELALPRVTSKSTNTSKNSSLALTRRPQSPEVELPTNLGNDFVGETGGTNGQVGLKRHIPQEVEQLPNGKESSLSARAPAKAGEAGESLRCSRLVEVGPADNDGKSGWNVDDDRSSTVSLSPRYPPDEERRLLWSSSDEGDL